MPELENATDRLAVLIDADNASRTAMKAVMAEPGALPGAEYQSFYFVGHGRSLLLRSVSYNISHFRKKRNTRQIMFAFFLYLW